MIRQSTQRRRRADTFRLTRQRRAQSFIARMEALHGLKLARQQGSDERGPRCVAEDPLAALQRRLAWRHGPELAETIISEAHPPTEADLRAWKALGRRTAFQMVEENVR